MRSKISFERSWLYISIAGVAFSSISLIVTFFLGAPQGSVASQSSQNLISGQSVESPDSEAGPGLPVRLKIPAINVDAAVVDLGLAADGAMDVPKAPSDVGWFQLGSRPGQTGSAVLDGHYGIWKNGDKSVFDNLYKLRSGDKLYIEDDTGTIMTFVVVGSKNYEPDADSSDIFGSTDGKAHLNLITCEGVWDEAQKSYSKRLIVFTDKETTN
ncbi:MAG: class F sortase [Candidatus Doudnabacteria bacterium]